MIGEKDGGANAMVQQIEGSFSDWLGKIEEVHGKEMDEDRLKPTSSDVITGIVKDGVVLEQSVNKETVEGIVPGMDESP